MARLKMNKDQVHYKAKKGTFGLLVKLLFKDFKGRLIICAICILLVSLSNLASSIFVKNITDTIEHGIRTNTNPWPELSILLIFMGSIYLVGLVASFAYNYVIAMVTQRFLNKLRIDLFDHMESLPIKYFDQNKRGNIMSIYTNDIDTIRQLISGVLPTIFQTVFMITALTIVMLSYSIYLFIIILIGSLFMLLNTKKVGGKASSFFVQQQIALGDVEGNIEESINGLKVIKVFSHEEKSIEDFDKKNDHLCEVATKGNINGNIMGPIMGNIGNFLYVFVAIVGALLFVYKDKFPNLTLIGFKEISYGVILSFLMMARMFTNNINNFAQNFTFMVMGIAGASRVFDLLDEQSETDNGYVTLVNVKYNEDGSFEEVEERTGKYAWKHPHGDGTLTYTPLKGDIVLDDVDFGYVPEKIVLHNVSIYAHPGQRVAFVGATGAGKTTITNLINRFYDIADGKIRYDGININKIKKDDLRRSLGIVLQDTNLFSGTVMENIRYGRLDATDEEVIEAAKIANAYDFITRLPEGFNTMLTGDGANLSQGQRQLLSIARAAVADAPVMILDEATSSIDTRTEKLVQKGTDNLMKGRTVFIIAHRLSTVQNSDVIMVLDHGRIIERGTHDDLIAQKGVYYELYTGAFELE